MDRAQAAGRVRRAADGRITGIAGLSVEPTPHRITIADETRWTWCALDAIGILGALQADGTVHSTDATTDNPVDITFHNGTPLDLDAALFIAGDFGSGSVVDQWCPLVNFFETPDNATQWADANRVEGNAYTVTQLIDQVTEGWEQVVDPKAGKTC